MKGEEVCQLSSYTMGAVRPISVLKLVYQCEKVNTRGGMLRVTVVSLVDAGGEIKAAASVATRARGRNAEEEGGGEREGGFLYLRETKYSFAGKRWKGTRRAERRRMCIGAVKNVHHTGRVKWRERAWPARVGVVTWRRVRFLAGGRRRAAKVLVAVVAGEQRSWVGFNTGCKVRGRARHA